MNLDILLAKATLFEKLASDLDVNELIKMVKTSLEKAFKAYPSLMDGFLYLSNVNVLIAENLISFTINLDSDKSYILNKNKIQRDNLIKSIIRSDLKNIFGPDLAVTITENLV
jgi:hypothetical protein